MLALSRDIYRRGMAAGVPRNGITTAHVQNMMQACACQVANNFCKLACASCDEYFAAAASRAARSLLEISFLTLGVCTMLAIRARASANLCKD